MFSYQLNKKEKLIRIARRHPITFLITVIKAITIFLIIGMGGYEILKIYQGDFKGLALMLGLLLAGLYLSVKWITWSTTVLIITDQRIIDIDKKSLVNKVVTQAEYQNIQEVLYEIKGIIATLFKVGSVFIKTSEGTIALEGVYKPEKIYTLIIETKKSAVA